MRRRFDAVSRRRLRWRSRLLLSFALLAPPGAILAQTAPAETSEADLQEGLRHLKAGRFEQALVPLARFKETFPEDARGWHYSGVALAAARRWREAAAEFSAAVERDPDRLEYRLLAASALAEVDQLDSALELLKPYDRARLGEQDDPALLWTLADLHYRRQQYAQALAALQNYSRIVPADPRADVQMGRIRLLENQFEEAASAFRSALAKRPEEAAAHQGLGLALARLGQPEPARESLRKAAELEPDNAAYWLDLGRLLLEQGAAAEAVSALRRAAASASPPPAVQYELSRAYRRAGEPEKARQALEEFQRLDQAQQQARVTAKRVEGLLKTGQDRLREGKVGAARDAFSEALQLDPDNELAHSFLAKIYLSSNLLGQAAPHLLALQKSDPDSVEGNFLLATYWYRTRELGKALAAAEKARQLRPDYADLRNLLGNIYFSLDRRQDALEEYAAAMRLEPEREEFRRNYETARSAGN